MPAEGVGKTSLNLVLRKVFSRKMTFEKITKCVKEIFNPYTYVRITENQEYEESLRRQENEFEKIIKQDTPLKSKFNKKYTFDNWGDLLVGDIIHQIDDNTWTAYITKSRRKNAIHSSTRKKSEYLHPPMYDLITMILADCKTKRRFS